MRQRLSWDKEKVAEIEKKADPYTMNQDRRNPPVSKYQTGDPSAWAEDPHMATPWKTEGRTETGHPAPAREAVVTARRLEDKAIKCITIAQRMLPGASDEDIENQATDLMFMPDNSILSTLQRQASVAEAIAKAAGEDEEEMEEEEKEAGKKEEMEEEKEAGKKKEEEEDNPKYSAEKKEEEEKEAGKKKEMEEEKEAGKKKEEEEDNPKYSAEKKEEEEKEAGKKKEEEEDNPKYSAEKKKEDTPEEEKEAAKKEDTPEEEKKEAGDLLDQIFETELSANKTGAKKLSGIVKQASDGNALDNLWSSAPDVSSIFGR